MTPDTENIHEQPDLLEERLSAYLDDMLDAGERAQLEAHLATCDTCPKQLAELRLVRGLLRALPQPALPRSFLLPVEAAPVPATTAASHATPLPLRSTTRRQRVARMARAAQWLGTIAAVLGLAIVISTAVLGARGGMQASSADSTASGGATSAQSPAYSDQNAATATKAASTFTATGAPEVTSGQHNPKAASGAQSPTATTQPPFLNLQLGGGGLLVAGILLVIVSSVTRRRNRVSQPAPPATGN